MWRRPPVRGASRRLRPPAGRRSPAVLLTGGQRSIVYTSAHGDVAPVTSQSLAGFVLGRVARYAATDPAKLAVHCVASGRAITYGELGPRVDAAARRLRDEHGFGVGDTLLIHMPNGPEYPVAFYAALRLFGVVSTSNPLYTATELSHQIRDSKAKHVVTVAPFAATVAEAIALAGTSQATTASVLGTPECPVALAGAEYDDGVSASERHVPALDADVPASFDAVSSVAALPYSSGTTGLPKGVRLSHSNLATNLVQCETYFAQRPDLIAQADGDTPSPETLLGLLPMFHIYGMNTVLNYALTQGATLASLPKFEPETFLKAFKDAGVTIAHLVPPLLLFLAQHGAPLKASHFSRLKAMCSGAAPLDAATQSTVQAALGVNVFQGYGMTETSPVTHSDLLNVPGSAGQLLPGTECRLVENVANDGEPPEYADVADPVGVGGELLVRGPQIMLGYLDRPDETAASLLPGGWLRTGDVAVVAEDGRTFQIIDRVKELIKVKGLQVSPAELEGVLLQHPSVTDAAVVAQPCDVAGELPHAFVVQAKDCSFSRDDHKLDVCAFLNDKVARFKHLHPERITHVEAIPKSASGKILRRQLKADLLGSPSSSSSNHGGTTVVPGAAATTSSG